MKKILQSFGLILAFCAVFQNQSVQAVNYAAYLPGVATTATSNTISYIQIPDLPITSLPFTMEMMVKPELLNSYGGFWTDRTSTIATNLQYGSNVANLRLDYGNATDHITSPDKGYNVPLINQWNHVALVVTATELKIYLNGVLYKKSAMTNTALPSNGVTYIGWDNAATTFNRTIKGQFDEIRFWNYERTADQLVANKTTTLTGTESGLIAYYNFDGQNANDLTANALNATAATGVTYVANTFTAYVPTISDWKAPLIGASVTGLNTFPSQYGWRCNSSTSLWSQLNGASSVRYIDNLAGFTYNTVAWTGRALYVRWDGTPVINSIYTYPVYLEANKAYAFSGKCGWVSGGGTATYSDFNFTINTNQNGNGTDIAYKSVRVLLANKSKFYDIPMSIVVPTSGVYYLTIKNSTDNTGTLGVIADLALIENTVADKTNLTTYIGTATTMTNTPQPVGTSNAYTLLSAAIVNAQAVVDNGSATVLDVATQESNVQAAINNVNSAILIYNRKSTWTTFPVDATSLIVNPSFESTDFISGWTNVGPFAKATSTALPNKHGTNFIEKYVNQPRIQTNCKIFQRINNVPNGTYVLTVNAQAIQQSNGSFPGGAFIYANSSRTEVFAAKDYSVLVKVTDNTLEVGFEVISSGNWMSLDNFRLSALSDGSVPYYFVTPSTLLFDANNLTKTFTVIGDYVPSNSTLSAPAGIILNKAELTPAEVIAGVTVTGTFNNSTVITAGAITVANGSTSKSITVNTSVDNGCFTPLYSGITNIVADPFLNSLETYTPSWGLSAAGASINNDLAFVYCGSGSGKVTGTRAGSIAYPLTGKLVPNTNYRIKAKVNITAGSFKFNMAGWSGALADIGTVFTSAVTGWQDFDLPFTTGATLGATPLFYFNNYDANTLGTGYIDNVEMYAVPKVYTSAASLTFLGLSSKKVAVRAVSLTSGITITAPASFSVSPGTMLSTVSGSTADSLTVTFNGPNSASGYVYFTSGLAKDSVLVTGTVAPTLLASPNYVSLDELNTVGTFSVSGGNLLTGITMSAPAGITLSPTSLPSTANGAVVTVTYDGNANSTGYISLTSGAASTRVRVRATKNADSFTALYPNGTNLISDPYLNDLATFGGWGTKTINTDTAFVYGGSRSGKLSGTAQCSGSIDKVLTGVMKANTKYRVKAMVYAVDGTFQIGVYGWGKADTTSIVSTTGSWQTVDFQFTTTATLAATQGLFFNSCWIGGMNGYIDNFEAYEMPGTATSVNSMGVQNQSIYIQAGKLATDFNLSQSSEVELSVYNMQGMLISKEKATYAAGQNHKVINANLSTGVYVVRMAVNGRFFTQKVIK